MEHQNAVMAFNDPTFRTATLRTVIGRISDGCCTVFPSITTIFGVGYPANKGANIIEQRTYREHKVYIGAWTIVGGQLNAVRIGQCIVRILIRCTFTARQRGLMIPGFAAVIRGDDTRMDMRIPFVKISLEHQSAGTAIKDPAAISDRCYRRFSTGCVVQNFPHCPGLATIHRGLEFSAGSHRKDGLLLQLSAIREGRAGRQGQIVPFSVNKNCILDTVDNFMDTFLIGNIHNICAGTV